MEDKIILKLTKKNQSISSNKDKKDLSIITKDMKEFNNYLDMIVLILKNKFVMISEFLDDIIKTIRIMDEWLITVDRGNSCHLNSNKQDLLLC